MKPRPVPFELKAKIEQDFERLQKMGVIEPVLRSDWAAPIVPVPKLDGTIQICGDFRLTVNPAIQYDWYPLPTAKDLFTSVASCQLFSKMDLAGAYLQVELEEEAKKCMVINIHKGLFQYNRLPFGVSLAPSLFQHVIERAISGLDGVSCFLDDLILGSATKEEHDFRLWKLLTCLQEKAFRLKWRKCLIGCTSLQYLGHIVDSSGIRPLPEKVEAIRNALVIETAQRQRKTVEYSESTAATSISWVDKRPKGVKNIIQNRWHQQIKHKPACSVGRQNSTQVALKIQNLYGIVQLIENTEFVCNRTID